MSYRRLLISVPLRVKMSLNAISAVCLHRRRRYQLRQLCCGAEAPSLSIVAAAWQRALTVSRLGRTLTAGGLLQRSISVTGCDDLYDVGSRFHK